MIVFGVYNHKPGTFSVLGAVPPQKSVYADFKCMLRHNGLLKKIWVREWWEHFFEFHSEGSELIYEAAKKNFMDKQKN